MSADGYRVSGRRAPPARPGCPDNANEHKSKRHQCACLYRAWHWAIWPRLLATPSAGNLAVEDQESWSCLWGRVGAELFRCFLSGDHNIRRDMIFRAAGVGAFEVAARLDKWRLALEGAAKGEDVEHGRQAGRPGLATNPGKGSPCSRIQR